MPECEPFALVVPGLGTVGALLLACVAAKRTKKWDTEAAVTLVGAIFIFLHFMIPAYDVVRVCPGGPVVFWLMVTIPWSPLILAKCKRWGRCGEFLEKRWRGAVPYIVGGVIGTLLGFVVGVVVTLLLTQGC